jgi:hypothetical protein
MANRVARDHNMHMLRVWSTGVPVARLRFSRCFAYTGCSKVLCSCYCRRGSVVKYELAKLGHWGGAEPGVAIHTAHRSSAEHQLRVMCYCCCFRVQYCTMRYGIHAPATHLLPPWLYGPLTALASFITWGISFLSISCCRHLWTFICRRSLSRSFYHLSLGLHIPHLRTGFLSNILTPFPESILATRPLQSLLFNVC